MAKITELFRVKTGSGVTKVAPVGPCARATTPPPIDPAEIKASAVQRRKSDDFMAGL
jgi:hypothetical protein